VLTQRKVTKERVPPEPIKEDIQPSAYYTELIPIHVSFDSLFSWTPAAPCGRFYFNTVVFSDIY